MLKEPAHERCLSLPYEDTFVVESIHDAKIQKCVYPL